MKIGKGKREVGEIGGVGVGFGFVLCIHRDLTFQEFGNFPLVLTSCKVLRAMSHDEPCMLLL